MVHQYNSTTYGSVYRCTTVVLPNPLLVNRAPELTDFALQIALPHFMRIFLGRVLAHYHSTEHGLSVTTIYDRLFRAPAQHPPGLHAQPGKSQITKATREGRMSCMRPVKNAEAR